MLKKKPHYAKFFTELEEEMDDRHLFISNHESMQSCRNLDAAEANALYRNRLSAVFRNSHN